MDIMKRTQVSRELFAGDYNCAQSVIKALTDVSQLEDYLSEALTAGFGGGVGGHQEICGAVSGASLAISHAIFKMYDDNALGKDKAREAVSIFVSKFKESFGNVRCHDLTGYDFSDEVQKQAFVDSGTKERVCMKAVEFSVDLAHEMIVNHEDGYKSIAD